MTLRFHYILAALAMAMFLTGCSHQTQPPIPETPTVEDTDINTIYNFEGISSLSVSGASSWLPYVSDTPIGEIPVGGAIAILEESFVNTNIDIEIHAIVPWDTLLEDVLSHKTDMVAGIYKSSERMNAFVFSEPFAVDQVNIYVKAGNEFPFNQIEDLKEKTALIPIKASYGDTFDQFRSQMNVIETTGKKEAFKLLMDDEADFFISANTDVIPYLIQHHLETSIVALKKPVDEKNVYFAMAKDNPKIEVMEHLNSRILELKENGDIGKLLYDFMRITID